MPNDDPLRLKQMRGAPPELVRALEALRNGANETARLERVASKLGPLLDAAPNAVPNAGSAPRIATAIKLIIGGLVLLVPALFILRSGPSEKPPVAVLPIESAKLETPTPEAALEPVAVPRREPAPALATEHAASAVPLEHAYHDKARAAQSVKTHGHPPLPAARSGATVSAISSADAPAANPTSAPAEAAQASQPSQQNADARGIEPLAASVQQQPKAASVATLNPVVRSEAELLFEARRAMPGDAARALRLLGEHEKRYPNGRLVPEREVLAIEALRSLGRKVEADARLRSFEARYPDSFHLQRLQH